MAQFVGKKENFKKAYAKKVNSGRSSGNDKIRRKIVDTHVETRSCLACNCVGHLVKDCRDKAAKDACLSKREKKQSRLDDDSDEPRGRKRERHTRERSNSRESSRDRSQEPGA